MSKNKRLNPIQKALANPKSLRAAINGKCFECGGDQYKEVILCKSKDCPLWSLRPWKINETTKIGKTDMEETISNDGKKRPDNVSSIDGAANKNVLAHAEQDNSTRVDRQVKADTTQPR